MLQASIDPKKGEWPSDAPDPQRVKEATEVLTATLMQQNDGLDRELRRRVGMLSCLHMSEHCAAWPALEAVLGVNGPLLISPGDLATGNCTGTPCTASSHALHMQGHSSSRFELAHDRAAAALTLRPLCRWQMLGA